LKIIVNFSLANLFVDTSVLIARIFFCVMILDPLSVNGMHLWRNLRAYFSMTKKAFSVLV
jgi:hypothetical protein